MIFLRTPAKGIPAGAPALRLKFRKHQVNTKQEENMSNLFVTFFGATRTLRLIKEV
jgi:hypothetical protein